MLIWQKQMVAKYLKYEIFYGKQRGGQPPHPTTVKKGMRKDMWQFEWNECGNKGSVGYSNVRCFRRDCEWTFFEIKMWEWNVGGSITWSDGRGKTIYGNIVHCYAGGVSL